MRFRPDERRYSTPERFQLEAGPALEFFSSHYSYVLSSLIDRSRTIFIAIAPDCYYVPERGASWDGHPLLDDLSEIGFRPERLPPMEIVMDDNVFRWTYDPVYRITQDQFVGLMLRYR